MRGLTPKCVAVLGFLLSVSGYAITPAKEPPKTPPAPATPTTPSVDATAANPANCQPVLESIVVTNAAVRVEQSAGVNPLTTPAVDPNAAHALASAKPSRLGKSAKWREATTNPTSDGEYFRTSREREDGMKGFAKIMGNEIIEDGAIPFVEFFPAEGVDVAELPTEGYQTRVLTDLVFSNLKGGAGAKGTFLLPVSGHVGEENARKWAKTDTYNIVLKHPDGRQEVLIKNAPSKDLVTAQEIKLPPLEKSDVLDASKDARAEKKWSKVYKLEYHRSGSLGPGGYYEGRVINVIWDGT